MEFFPGEAGFLPLSLRPGSRIVKRPETGALLNHFPIEEFCGHYLALADIDGDGLDEVIVANRQRVWVFDNPLKNT